MHQNTRCVCEKSRPDIVHCSLQAVTILLLLLVCMVSAHATETFDEFVEKHFIIGGQPVERNVYPWMVALTYDADAELEQRQFCGGTLI